MPAPPTQREVDCPRAEGVQARRVLLYCLQNSGCTLFAMALAQLPSTIVVPDLWIGSRIPCPADFRSSALQPSNATIVVKMTLRAQGAPAHAVDRLSQIRAAFQPHLVLFLTRDACVNALHLSNKSFANEHGTVVAKMQHWDVLYKQRDTLANATFNYESLCDGAGVAPLVARLHKLGLVREPEAIATSRLLRFEHNFIDVKVAAIKGTAHFSTQHRGWPLLHYTISGVKSLPGGLAANTSGLGACRDMVEREWQACDTMTMGVSDASAAAAWARAAELAPNVAAFYAKFRRRWYAANNASRYLE